MDQEYAYKVLRGFSDSGLPAEVWYLVLLVLSIVAALTAGILWFNNKELRKRIRKYPASWIVDPIEIRRTIDVALLYRSKIDLSFHSDSDIRKTVPCSIVDFSNDISLEIPLSHANGSIMLEREVDCFFNIPTEHSGQYRFYKFTTTITDFTSTGSNISTATLKIPTHLEQTQHRNFLRVSPPSGHYDYLNIIPETKPTLQACLQYIKSSGEYLPENILNEDSKIILADISGGGISIEITKFDTHQSKEMKFANGKFFFVLLGLVDTGNKGILRYLFRCKIRRLYLDSVQAKMSLGLSFETQFTGFNKDTGKPKWINLEGHGCPEIDNWAYQIYLDLYREGIE